MGGGGRENSSPVQGWVFVPVILALAVCAGLISFCKAKKNWALEQLDHCTGPTYVHQTVCESIPPTHPHLLASSPAIALHAQAALGSCSRQAGRAC